MSDSHIQAGEAATETPTRAAQGHAAAADEYAAPVEPERRPRRFRGSGVSAAERERLLREVRNVEFAMGLRGYDRGAVDRYVEQVNRLLAELEISASPESAVRHALDEVSEETRELLQRAHETAEDITNRSRVKADERVEHAAAEAQHLVESAQHKAEEVRAAAEHEIREHRERVEAEAAETREAASREAAAVRAAATREATATREAAEHDAQRLRSAAQQEADATRSTARSEAEELVAGAEARARELIRNAEAVWRERRRLIDDMRAVGEQLVAIGEAEGKRFQHFVGDPRLAGEREDGSNGGAPEPAAAAT
jgi:DivIVA domain-containing protein